MAVENYGNDSISSLKGENRVRLRPEAILGSSGIAGSQHTVTEIVGNSLDEATSGYGTKIDIKRYKDGAISVRDYGRGVPLGWNESEQRWNWDLVYNEMYAGGKYDDGQEKLKAVTPQEWASMTWNWLVENFNYLFSIGLNGLGGSATQYSSKYFVVRSYRDGECSEMRFEKGRPIYDELKVFSTDEENGTFIKWKPDDEVFTDTNITSEWLINSCGDTLQVAGVDFNFEDEETGETKHLDGDGVLGIYQNKLNWALQKPCSTLEELNETLYHCEELTHGNVTVKGKSNIYVCNTEVLFGFTKSNKQVYHYCYHNNIKMSAGVQYDAVVAAISNFFTTQGRARDIKVESADYANHIACVVSTHSNLSDLRGQTKDSVHNSFIYDSVYKLITDTLNIELGKGNPELESVVSKVIENATVRIQVREMAKIAREQKRSEKRAKPNKFVSCRAYDQKKPELAELWIAEGDSASDCLKKARNSDFQALYPIRGKVLNVMKVGIDKIVSNSVITEIFNILETGMDLGIDEDSFDIDRLRFNKIIFATDADEDGYQIRVLLFLIFYRLAPQLLVNGNVYIAEPPLFQIKFTDGTVRYAIDNNERDEILKEYEGKIQGVSRFKGLGEMNPDVLRETTVHPDHRHLIPLTMSIQDENCREIINVLFGADKFGQRKQVITEILGSDIADMINENALLFNQLEETEMEDDLNIITVE